MCGVTGAILGTAALLASGLAGGGESPKAPSVQTYVADDQKMKSEPPPPPAGTPAFGSKEDAQNASASDATKKNKKGRQALRIDRDPTAPLPGAGQSVSGTVIPKG